MRLLGGRWVQPYAHDRRNDADLSCGVSNIIVLMIVRVTNDYDLFSSHPYMQHMLLVSRHLIFL